MEHSEILLMQSNQFKHEIEALEAKRAFDLTNKEAKDYNDLKHICILLGFIGTLMIIWLGYVIICL